MLKKIGFAILLVLVAIQFISNKPVELAGMAENDFITYTNTPEEVANILKTSCYDCHSFQTNYPWYANVAPVSWWVFDHINEGRDELNFSQWGVFTEKRKTKKLKEIMEEVEEGEMPLSSYTITHGNAKLSEKNKEDLINWIKYLSKK